MKTDFEPEVILIFCNGALNGDSYLPEGVKRGSGFKARFIRMPCSSKIETGYLVKLIERGADGIEVIACPGKKCQFIVGSARAESRVDYARTLLEEAGLSADRVGIRRKNHLTADEIMNIAEERANAIRPLGQNPMKAVRIESHV
jgi:coenzyme F420-reducing hydrogenase delta subunit